MDTCRRQPLHQSRQKSVSLFLPIRKFVTVPVGIKITVPSHSYEVQDPEPQEDGSPGQ